MVDNDKVLTVRRLNDGVGKRVGCVQVGTAELEH